MNAVLAFSTKPVGPLDGLLEVPQLVVVVGLHDRRKVPQRLDLQRLVKVALRAEPARPRKRSPRAPSRHWRRRWATRNPESLVKRLVVVPVAREPVVLSAARADERVLVAAPDVAVCVAEPAVDSADEEAFGEHGGSAGRERRSSCREHRHFYFLLLSLFLSQPLTKEKKSSSGYHWAPLRNPGTK